MKYARQSVKAKSTRFILTSKLNVLKNCNEKCDCKKASALAREWNDQQSMTPASCTSSQVFFLFSSAKGPNLNCSQLSCTGVGKPSTHQHPAVITSWLGTSCAMLPHCPAMQQQQHGQGHIDQRFSNWGPRTKGGPRRVPMGSARGFRKVVIVCTVFNNLRPISFQICKQKSISLSALCGSVAVVWHDRLSVDVS